MPRARKRTNYAEVKLSTGDSTGKMINAVRKAFEDLASDGRVTSRCGTRGHSDPEEAEARVHQWEVNYAVHSIVCGLSRATAHPPHWFRLAGRPVASKKGRPRASEGEFIAWQCADHFTRITGDPAKVQTDPQTPHRPYGAFYDLVVAVFDALAIPDGAERCARSVQKSSAESAQRNRKRN